MAAANIQVSETPLVLYTLRRADDALILGHRLSEWCGHAPMMEEDMALSNIALDLIGQARELYTYAARVEGKGNDEDKLAYLRDVLWDAEHGGFVWSLDRRQKATYAQTFALFDGIRCEVMAFDLFTGADNDCPFDHIAKLADVAGPRMKLQRFESCGAEKACGPVVFLGELRDEMLRE